MDINKNCKLFLNEVYNYDIEACHYTILKKLGYGIENLPADDKQKRNTIIGLMMKENPRLISVLRKTTEATISEYIIRNNISEDEIIIRQYDGFLTTKVLKETNLNIPIDLRYSYYSFLISFDRRWFLGFDGNHFTIKGIPNRYDKMDNIFKKIIGINFANKQSIFKNLQKIKDEIFETNDASLFCIPTSQDKYIVHLKEYGETQISGSMVNIIDSDDINREKYFNFYIRPFTQSIIFEFI